MLPKRLCQIGKTLPLIPRVGSLSLVAGFSWISAAVLREYYPCLFTTYRWPELSLTESALRDKISEIIACSIILFLAREINMKNSTFGVNRIEAFSDGVLAIVITLPVLEIKSPELHIPTSSAEA